MKKRFQKLTSFVLALVMVVTMVPAGIFVATAEGVSPELAAGLADIANTTEFVINNVDDWKAVAAVSNQFIGKTIKLGADIDAQGATLPQLFAAQNPQATFDGNGYTIKNVGTKEAPNTTSLFSNKSCLNLKNVKVDNVHVNGTGNRGILIDWQNAWHKYTFRNITVTNSSVVAAAYAGALVGYMSGNGGGYGVDFENIKVSGCTIEGNAGVGSLIGYTYLNANDYGASAKNVEVVGTTITDNTAASCAAGLFGFFRHHTGTILTVENAYVAATFVTPNSSGWTGVNTALFYSGMSEITKNNIVTVKNCITDCKYATGVVQSPVLFYAGKAIYVTENLFATSSVGKEGMLTSSGNTINGVTGVASGYNAIPATIVAANAIPYMITRGEDGFITKIEAFEADGLLADLIDYANVSTFVIKSVEDWNMIATSGMTFSGKTVQLGNDIDANGATLLPLAPFEVNNSSITLDGQGYAIKNVGTAEAPQTQPLVSEKFSGGTVKNITFQNITMVGADATYGSGLIADWLNGWGTVTVQNVKVLGCSISDTASSAGALFGRIINNNAEAKVNIDGVIIDDATTIKAATYAGGVIGYISGNGGTYNVSRVYTEATVESPASAGYTGGLVGYTNASTSFVLQLNFSTNVVKGKLFAIDGASWTGRVGGILGRATNGQDINVKNCLIAPTEITTGIVLAQAICAANGAQDLEIVDSYMAQMFTSVYYAENSSSTNGGAAMTSGHHNELVGMANLGKDETVINSAYKTDEKGFITEVSYVPVCNHDWVDATCEDAKFCTICGETEGEALGHDWADATCETAKTCNTCGATEGEAPGHNYPNDTDPCTVCGKPNPAVCEHHWIDATCETPKTCELCAETEGEALGHDFADATCTAPKTCNTCGATEGDALGHTWVDATTEAPKTCTTCGVTEGQPLPPPESNEIIINSVEDWMAIAAMNSQFEGKIIKLGADIDAKGAILPQLFMAGNVRCTFDGQGYTIKNVGTPENPNPTSLFSSKSNLNIQNLTLENVHVAGEGNKALLVDWQNCWAIYTFKSIKVVNCSVKATGYAAALVAYMTGNGGNYGMNFDKIYITDTSIEGNAGVAGLIGYTYMNSTDYGASAKNVRITNTTITDNTAASCAAGLFGFFRMHKDVALTVNSCYVSATFVCPNSGGWTGVSAALFQTGNSSVLANNVISVSSCVTNCIYADLVQKPTLFYAPQAIFKTSSLYSLTNSNMHGMLTNGGNTVNGVTGLQSGYTGVPAVAITNVGLEMMIAYDEDGFISNFLGANEEILPDYATTDEFIINSIDDWKKLSASHQTFNGKVIKLGADIDAQGAELPYLIYTVEASGATFDGQGFTIRNVGTAENPVTTSLIAYAFGGGVIKNVTFENVYMASETEAAIIAICINAPGDSTTTIERIKFINCHVVSETSYAGMVAAKIGDKNANDVITIHQINIDNQSTVTGNKSTGSVVGYAKHLGILTISNVVTSALITGTGIEAPADSYDFAVGGLIGYSYSAGSSTINIHDCMINSTLKSAYMKEVEILDGETVVGTEIVETKGSMHQGGIIGLSEGSFPNTLFDENGAFAGFDIEGGGRTLNLSDIVINCDFSSNARWRTLMVNYKAVGYFNYKNVYMTKGASWQIVNVNHWVILNGKQKNGEMSDANGLAGDDVMIVLPYLANRMKNVDEDGFLTSLSAVVEPYGIQYSEVNDGKFSVRFIGTSNLIDEQNVVLNVKAITASGAVRTFSVASPFFDRITAFDAHQIMDAPLVAKDINAEKLLCVTVYDIPVGEAITFELSLSITTAKGSSIDSTQTMTFTFNADGTLAQ